MTAESANRFPVSIKAVLFTAAGEVVLLKNDRDEWELPGGRLDPGETPEQCLAREIAEELGIAACVEAILDSYVFEVIPGRHVFIVTYACTVVGDFSPKVSHEHLQWAVFRTAALPDNLPVGYRRSIQAACGLSQFAPR